MKKKLLVSVFCCLQLLCTYVSATGVSPTGKTLNNVRKFVIVTASYNNIKFVSDYLESIFSQKCDEREYTFRVIYCDDCSTDGTAEFVEAYKEKFGLGDKLRVVRSDKRIGGHEHIYDSVHSCDDDEIVLIVDGDDWLARNDVLEILNKVYSDPDVWITYGQFKRYPSNEIGFCRAIPDSVISSNSIRSYKWVSAHLRTFYSWLYKCIKKEDLMLDGKFLPVCGDLAIMVPMLEMAGWHYRFIPDVLYVYNCANNISYWTKHRNKCKMEKSKNRNKNKNKNSKNKNKNKNLNKSNELHNIMEWHIRKDLAPYSPLKDREEGAKMKSDPKLVIALPKTLK